MTVVASEEMSLASAIGARMRALRLQRHLSLREVARRSGVSHGLLSQIESGRTNPSVATLARVTSVFGVSLADTLLVTESRQSRVVRRHERRPFEYPGGGPADRLLTADADGEFTVSQTRIAAGVDSGGMYEHIGGLECVVVLDGELEFDVGDEHWVLHAGDAITLHARESHSWCNSSGRPTEVLWVLATRHARGR